MPGTITFKPIEANLNHDKDIIGKADPYCMFIVNGEKIKSQVCKSGGTHPIWDDAITIPASNQPTCFVEIKDKDILKDDKLGSFEIDLREIESQGRLKKWYPIFHKDKPAGEILMEAVFSPQGGYQQGLGGYQQQGMPLQTGAPLQTHGAPIHSTAIPITSQSISGQQTLHTQGVLLGTQPLGQPITQSIGQPLGQPIGQPITQQTQHIVTKETLISGAPLGQQQLQPGMQYSGMLPGQGLADSSYGYGYTGESMSEHYAKEALIRGVDPLGTHLHQYPEQMLGSQLVGGIPQSNLTSGIMNPGLQQNLPGQQLPGQLPGQLNQRNIM